MTLDSSRPVTLLVENTEFARPILLIICDQSYHALP